MRRPVSRIRLEVRVAGSGCRILEGVKTGLEQPVTGSGIQRGTELHPQRREGTKHQHQIS